MGEEGRITEKLQHVFTPRNLRFLFFRTALPKVLKNSKTQVESPFKLMSSLMVPQYLQVIHQTKPSSYRTASLVPVSSLQKNGKAIDVTLLLETAVLQNGLWLSGLYCDTSELSTGM